MEGLDTLSIVVILNSFEPHETKVVFELLLLPIRAHKDDLHFLWVFYSFVELGQEWSELPARRAPVSREVESYKLYILKDILNWHKFVVFGE